MTNDAEALQRGQSESGCRCLAPVSTPMKDGLTLVERYFVEELKSHFGESLAWKWLACEKRRKFTEEGVCLMPRSSSQAHAALGMKQSMQRSHSESSLGSLHSKA